MSRAWRREAEDRAILCDSHEPGLESSPSATTLRTATAYRDGLPMHANMLEYRVPTMLDSPPIHTHIVESIDPNGPFGAKEASEGGIAGFMPAFAQAVADAIGIDIDHTPVTPDCIVDAMRKAQRLAALGHTPRHDGGAEPAP